MDIEQKYTKAIEALSDIIKMHEQGHPSEYYGNVCYEEGHIDGLRMAADKARATLKELGLQ